MFLNTLISIIVPIYKVENYIKKCVDSIISQTYRNLEIILVDDGSPDSCPDICDFYAKQDSRVKVIHKKNGGLMSARQAGLKQATGDYVGFVDGDDWIEPDMYAHFADAIEKYNPDMALCEFFYSFPEKDDKSTQLLSKAYFSKTELENEIYPTMLFKGSYYTFGINPCCWSKLFRKELLENNLYSVTPKVKIGEDAAFTYPCLLEADSLAYVDKFLYHYRVNPQSMTKSYDAELEETILIPYEILKTVFSKYPYDLSMPLNYYLLYSVNGVIRNEASPQCKKSRSEKKRTFKKFTSNSDVAAAAKSIDYSILPLHTRLVAGMLAGGNTELLYLYSVLLKKFL